MTIQNNDDEEHFSLLSPAAMGGIIGGDGYSFQDRYIVCHIPIWLSSPDFLRFMNEGTGDVDIVYLHEEQHFFDHVQVKDHQVTPSEFYEVIRTFVTIDRGTGKKYRKFILASPALSPTLASLATALRRYKDAISLYGAENEDAILSSTKHDIIEKISKLRLGKYEEFLLNKLDFDTVRFDFHDNITCMHLFVGLLGEHSDYKSYIASLLKPVYSKLIEIVPAKRGKVLDAKQLHELIKTVLKDSPSVTQDTVLHIHNWSFEKFEPAPTYELNWSSYFDRSTRKIPDVDVWASNLIPQLLSTRQEIASSTSNRHIIFRGKCTLSTGIALGMIFPEIGNWSFELLQYPAIWRSDVLKIKDYAIRYDELDPAHFGLETDTEEIAVIFNITGDALNEVTDYFKNCKAPVRKFVLIYASEIPGTLSIADDIQAVSLASAAKDIIKRMTSKYRARKTHLFYFGPLGLAIFLGQKLTSVGEIHLYEYQDPGYKQSCVMKT